jgi:hypothetical protein
VAFLRWSANDLPVLLHKKPMEKEDFFILMSKKCTIQVVITKHYDLLLWLMQQVPKFPRSHKFVLGDRIQNHVLDELECLIEAAYSKQCTWGLPSYLWRGN